ncbi:uncharacterized protein LOC126858529 isoform X1 [Cataglyphis hispanica]|uniref:uncharacterized protein LOC126858529 isoform X1 n=1 Tax=Cataglyphis hispanica TaxID=1086592 RepID=UPI00218066E9|nr:uncharacterized protein LOC126858529 isoform X1 [Cataglyphis hispanica]
MALSKALLKRLNSDDDPLPKRLKLAETAFSATDLALVCKEDLLLEWLCKICVMDRHAWKSLNNCLKSAHIDIKTNAKQRLVDMLAQTLHSDMIDVYEEVLECCSLILANNSMRQYFTNEPKNLGFLIKTLFNNVFEHSSCHNAMQEEYDQLLEPCKLSRTENYAIISIIESLMQIYKLIATKNELRLVFIQDILYPMCNLIDHRHTDNTNKLGVVAYKCIQQLLIKETKLMRNEQISKNVQTMFSDLFCTLSENVETLNFQSNFLTYQFIFRTVLGTYKLDAALLDAFFRNLINSSGKYKWEILNAFLKLLNNVTLDFDNIIENVTLFEYFQKIISDILTYDNITCIHYGILTQLSYINPLLIEKNIPDIFNKVLMKEQTNDYTNLLIAVLHSSKKLRREQKLISQLLISLKQHLTMRKTYKTNTPFFSYEFRIKLRETINNFSSSQTIATLKTLIYYLNIDCVELLECNTSRKNILILQATVELLVVFFEGTQIFEYIRTLSTHEKFVNDLDKLGNTLSLLINKALCLSHDKNVIILLLSAVQSLSEIQDLLKYYVPKSADTKKLLFPILDDPWQQLIQRITNFGEDNCKNIMNKLILHRIKLNTSNEPIKLHGLIGGLEYAWSSILKCNADILPLLSDKEISKVTCLLLDDITSSEKNFHEWLGLLDNDCLQENRRFVTYLLNHIFTQIGHCLSSGCTKSITEHINTELLMKNEHDDMLGVLQIIKELISQEQWVQMTNATSSQIELHLELLLHLPLMYFNSNIRMLIFLLVYSISRECEKNEILTLCKMIFSDLLEKVGIDIFQYIEPIMFVNQLPQNKAFLKACEFSLRNVKTYATFKNLIKNCTQCKETMYNLLECMEMVKPKLDAEQKIIFRKAEKRLAKAILKILPEKINNASDVKYLTAVLKITVSTGEAFDKLKKLTELTLENIITREIIGNINNTSNNTLLQQSIQLAIIVLRHRKMFEIQDTIIKNLWFIILKHPCKNLLEALLTSPESKEFYEFLRLLYIKTIDSLSQADETAWTNLFVIWSSIMKTDMRIKRNKARLHAINKLFEIVLSLDIPDKYWSGILRLSHDIISIKHLFIPDITIDLIVLVSLKSLVKVKISSCNNVLVICETLMKVKTNLIIDRLPNLLLLYRNVINIIVHASKSVSDKFDEYRFRCFALDIEKLTGLLIKLKKDMIRPSPYVIADFLQLCVEGSIPSYIKMALYNSISQLISICDQHGIAFLSRTLPTSLQEVFKVQLNTFNKFYKFSGKI